MFDSEVLNIVKEHVSGSEGTAPDWTRVQVVSLTEILSLTPPHKQHETPVLTVRELEQDLAHMGPSC